MNYELRILRVSESRAELVRAMPSGSKMFYEVKELRITLNCVSVELLKLGFRCLGLCIELAVGRNLIYKGCCLELLKWCMTILLSSSKISK